MTKSEDLVRAFICLNIPQEWEVALARVADPLKKLRSRISWTKSFHLTLKFLGGISPVAVEQVQGVLADVVKGFSPFTLTLAEVGCFPGLRAPRVLWVGVKADDNSLSDLQQHLDKGLERIGFQREKRGFTPHLTLARIRRLEAADRLGERLRSIKCPEVSPFRVTSIELMQSQLKRDGAQYSVLGSYALGG